MFESRHLFSDIMSFLVPELNSKILCLLRRMKERGWNKRGKKRKERGGKKKEKERGGKKKKKKKKGRGKKKRIEEGGNEKKKKKETVEWGGDGGLGNCGGF